MDYNHITSFLDKFKNLVSLGQRNNSTIAEIITKHISYPIKEEVIKIKGSVVYIDASPLLKSEIMVHKEGIMSDLRNMIPNRKFTEIR